MTLDQVPHRVRCLSNAQFDKPNYAWVRQPTQKTSSPKSLSSVTSTRSSLYASASNASSEASPYPSRAERTSCPRSINALCRVRDAAQASSRNFTKPLGQVRGHAPARPPKNDERRAGTHGYPRRGGRDTLPGCFRWCPPAANMARTCSTAIRMSRMIGLPPKMSARTVIRLSSSGSPIMLFSIDSVFVGFRQSSRMMPATNLACRSYEIFSNGLSFVCSESACVDLGLAMASSTRFSWLSRGRCLGDRSYDALGRLPARVPGTRRAQIGHTAFCMIPRGRNANFLRKSLSMVPFCTDAYELGETRPERK